MQCIDFIKNAKNRVLIESQALTTDEVGGSINIWSTVGTYWAWVQPLSSREQNINAQLRGQTTHRIVIRYQSTLADVKDTTSYRLILDNRIHEIRGLRNFDSDLKNYGNVYQELITDENAIVDGEFSIVTQIPNIEAAFSLRRINENYTDSLIKIRRDADDSEADIGFDVNGDLDTDAITTFLEASSPESTTAYIVTWYDQSGNGYDASIADSYQPTLNTSGLNSLPTIDFNGNSTVLSLGNNLGSFMAGASANYTVVSVLNIEDSSSSQTIWSKVGDDAQDPFTNNLRSPQVIISATNTMDMVSQTGDGGNFLKDTATISTGVQSLRWQFDLSQASVGNKLRLYKNNTEVTTTNTNAGSGNYTDLTTYFWIGGRGALANGNSFDGKISEFIFISSSLSSANASLLNSDITSYWGIS